MKRLGVLLGAAWLATGAHATTSPASLASSESAASAREPAPYVSIPFANHGGIRDWRADDNRSLWIEGRSGQWYYAEMFGPCFGLNFAERIGFVTAPYGSFDRWSSVIVDGQKCTIGSLRLSDPPAKLSRGDPTYPGTS
jgi:hypothetical protein